MRVMDLSSSAGACDLMQLTWRLWACRLIQAGISGRKNVREERPTRKYVAANQGHAIVRTETASQASG